VQQRVLPIYRAALFNALADASRDGLAVFAGQPLAEENIAAAQHLEKAELTCACNRNLGRPGSPFYSLWQPDFSSWLEITQPDALIVEANPRYRSTPQAIRWMHARGRPVIGWGLGAPPLSGRLAWLRRRSRQKLLASLDALIAYSRRGAGEYAACGFPAERIYVAPNAATPRPVWPLPERSPQFTGPPNVLFVGRIQARKRLDLLLRACAALPADLRPMLTITGDGPVRAELDSLARQIYPLVEFTGALHGPALDSRFRQADLFVLPGTGGLAVQQAMAYGLPVIAAEGDGTQDDLLSSQNGWRVEPGDVESLRIAIQEALQDPSRLRRMGAESFRIVRDEANLERMVAVFVQAATQALALYS